MSVMVAFTQFSPIPSISRLLRPLLVTAGVAPMASSSLDQSHAGLVTATTTATNSSAGDNNNTINNSTTNSSNVSRRSSVGSGPGSATPQTLTVAAGCFWGVEHIYRKNFGGQGTDNKGLLNARVGYCGGNTESPTYRAVCSGRTGHAEALQVIFDPSRISYRALVEFFYRMHDPTTLNQQGPDIGTQYRSAIFTHGDEQQRIAEDVTVKVASQWWKGRPIATLVVPAGKWWDAEEYHQLYLENNPSGYECPSHFVRNFPPLED